MRYALRFTPDSLKTAGKWKKSNPDLHKKLIKILEDISEHPKKGIGHPKPLVNGRGSTYSRRITAHHRIIYDIVDNIVEVHIIAIGGHYDDK